MIPATLVLTDNLQRLRGSAVYGSGYSVQDCFQFTSNFLYPAADLTGAKWRVRRVPDVVKTCQVSDMLVTDWRSRTSADVVAMTP